MNRERVQSALGYARYLSVGVAVVGLLALGLVSNTSAADRLALLVVLGLIVAAVSGWFELLIRGRYPLPLVEPIEGASKPWLFAAIAVILVAGLAVQTWFRAGTSIGFGDVTLPDGTAWLGRLFEPWTWTGSNLGEPSQLALSLPWACVLGIVHLLGGDPGLAQRVWYTTLFAAAGLSVLGLIASLRFGPVAGLVATAVYLLSPNLISEVGINPVFLAALCPLAAIPAALIAAGTGRLSALSSATVVAVQAPLLGYVFYDPPLVGMVLATMLATPFLVAWVDGKRAALQCLRAMTLAVPLLLATSAYWIVPSVVHLLGFSSNQVADLTSWGFTEVRANLRNALWLNNAWGWSYLEYFPYASTYDQIPFSIARFALPAIAFGALNVATRNSYERRRYDRYLRIAVVLATVAVAVIVLSTGTNSPGNIIFNPLYRLPFGWLLREPGRFLMLAALAYSVLIATTVEAVTRSIRLADIRAFEPVQLRLFSPTLAELIRSWHRRVNARRVLGPVPRLWLVPVSLGTSILLGFPIYTGALVPDTRPQLPSSHVTMPPYWQQMAGFVDQMPAPGGLLVLPPDDYYAMPYSWGYYGADSFVVDLFHRPVLVPNLAGGYGTTSTELVSAVNLTAESLLQHDWREAEALVTTLNTPLVLVRRDVVASFPGRSIMPPYDLVRALDIAPNFVLVKRIGDLDLYQLTSATRSSEVSEHFATVNTQAPDLRLLGLLPPRTALVSGETQSGVPNIVVPSQSSTWSIDGDTAVWRPRSPAGRTYTVADLDSRTVVEMKDARTVPIGTSGAKASYEPSAVGDVVTVSITGKAAISNGTFADGAWGPVRNCEATAAPPLSQRAVVIPSGAPGGQASLELSASGGDACVGQPVNWHGGPLLLSLMVKHVQGHGPRLCVHQLGPDRCLAAPDIPDNQHWTQYQAELTPDVGASAITLYLYADARSGNRTVNEYANVNVLELSNSQSLALFIDPPQNATPVTSLLLVHTTFSDKWRMSTGARHVLVDGMLNGWLMPIGSGGVPYYWPTGMLRAATGLSLVALGLITLFLVRRIVGLPRVMKRITGRWLEYRQS